MIAPHSASTACTVAPQRSMTSFMRPPNTPLTQTSTSSPASRRLVEMASMPAIPVAETGKVSLFPVWYTWRNIWQTSSMIPM
jgi:hypothetical protein